MHIVHILIPVLLLVITPLSSGNIKELFRLCTRYNRDFQFQVSPS